MDKDQTLRKLIAKNLNLSGYENIDISSTVFDPHTFVPYKYVRVEDSLYRVNGERLADYENLFELKLDINASALDGAIEKIDATTPISLHFYPYNEYEKELLSKGGFRVFTKEELQVLGFIPKHLPNFVDDKLGIMTARTRRFSNIREFVTYMSEQHTNRFVLDVRVHVWGEVMARIFYTNKECDDNELKSSV